MIKIIYNNIFSYFYDVNKETLTNNSSIAAVNARIYKPSKDLRSSILMSFLTNSSSDKSQTTIIENLFRSESPVKS